MKKEKLVLKIYISDIESEKLSEEFELDKLNKIDLDKEIEYLFGEAEDVFINNYVETPNSYKKGRSKQFQLAKSEIKEPGTLDISFFIESDSGNDYEDEHIYVDEKSPELDKIFKKLDKKVIDWIKKNNNKEKIIFNYKKYQKSINFVENFEYKVEKYIESSKPFKEEKLLYQFGGDKTKRHHFWEPKEKVYLEITKNPDVYFEISERLGLESEKYSEYNSFYEDKEGFEKFKSWFDEVDKDFDHLERKIRKETQQKEKLDKKRREKRLKERGIIK